MSKLLAVVTVCALGTVGFACAAPAEDENAAPEQENVETTESALSGKDAVRLAIVLAETAKYHDVNRAVADGYLPDPVCASSPMGAMGIHYVNPQILQQPLDPRKPSILLYEPTARGLRLVGVEWMQPVIVNGAPWMQPESIPPPPPFNPAPVLFGETFDGPMPGHNPQMPWHYDLHVWLWKRNPTGLFSAWNPNVHCPE